MDDEALTAEIDQLARESGFTGVVAVDRAGTALRRAHGAADRRCGVPMKATTRLGIASGTKTVTALVVLSLADEGVLALSTPARAVLGPDLPLIDDAVTVEDLLAHRSGIGDYLDETLFDDIADFELPVPAQRLSSTSAYLDVLDGFPTVSAPGAVFSYNNGGYVVLALIAERAAGTSFYDLVAQRVCAPAGLAATAFLRSDELPPDAAIGYLDPEGLRTNVFHLPVLGSGDGGLYTTVDDVARLWTALLGGRILGSALLEEMLRPRRHPDDDALEHGLGIWLHRDAPVLEMHGYDAGVSFRSVHHRESGATATVIASTGGGAWPFYELQDLVVRG